MDGAGGHSLFQTKTGHSIELGERAKVNEASKPGGDRGRPWHPKWLTRRRRIKGHYRVSTQDITLDINEQLIVELCAREGIC